MKDYYNEKEGSDDMAKNILIFIKKNIYKDDIKYIQYFLKLFNAEETELSKDLKKKKIIIEDEEHLDFDKLKDINDFLEKIKIYVNNGKDDSQSIQLIRLLYNRENEIKFAIEKDVDSAAALIYRLKPTIDSLIFNDILQYQNCVDFVNDFIGKMKDKELLTKLREKLSKMTEVSEDNKEEKEEDKKKEKKENTNIEKVLKTFEHYFIKYESIKTLDSDFDSSTDIYENIKLVLQNSNFKIELFKREFKVYKDDDRKEEIKIFQRDDEKEGKEDKKQKTTKVLDELIELKDNINLDFEDLPDDDEKSNDVEKRRRVKDELEEKRANIVKFVRYVEELQSINKYFTLLENKGCPFLIDVVINSIKGEIKYELVNFSLFN